MLVTTIQLSGHLRFVSGLVHALSPGARVRSPSFTLVNEIDGALPVFHVDLYRLNDPREIDDLDLDAADVEAAAELLRRTARSVVVTIGARGAVLVTRDEVTHIPAPPVSDVRDTTGAGDALVGVLAAALAQGVGLAEATAFGVRAASRSVTVDGVSEQYPDFALDTLRQGVRT